MPEEILKLNHDPMPTVGVSNYTLFELESDDVETGKATYKTAVPYPGTVEIAPTDNGASDVFDADNKAYYIESYLEKAGHEITNADIPPKIDALLRGLKTVDGGIEFEGNPEAPYFGVAWEVLKPNNVVRFVRYYKGKYAFASSVAGKTKPHEGATEKQTSKATYTAEKRDCDEKLFYILDSDSDDVKDMTVEEIREKWFSDLNWYPSNEVTTPAQGQGGE